MKKMKLPDSLSIEHDAEAFKPVSSLTVGEFRDYLLSYQVDGSSLKGNCRPA